MHGATGIHCTGGNGTNRRQHILDAVVELGMQCALVVLCSSSVSDIDVDAHYPLWAPVAAVRDETARLDPSNLAAGADETAFEPVFAPALAERAAAGCIGLITVIWVDPGQPLATCYFGCPLRQAIDGDITLRNLHLLRVDTVGEAADESGLTRQLQLHRALDQSQLSPLPLADCSSWTFDVQWAPRRVKLTPCCLLQPHLIAVRTHKSEGYGI